MKGSAFFPVLLVLLLACKGKSGEANSDDKSNFFPVLSYLKSQVRDVENSYFPIKMKITKMHSTWDTIYLKDGDFRAAAQDFLSLPEIASPDLRRKYTETKLYDADLKKVVLTYAPKDKNDFEQITRQDVLIEPGTSGSSDHVETVYIETAENNGDSSVQKKMTWNVKDSYGGDFQVIRLINKPSQPEQVQTIKVRWIAGP